MSLVPAKRTKVTQIGTSVFINGNSRHSDAKTLFSILNANPELTLTETSKPAGNTFEHTIVAADLPSGIFGWFFTKIVPMFGFQCENVSAGAVTLNFVATINGEEHTQSSTSVPAGSFGQSQDVEWNGFLDQFGTFTKDHLEVGDVVGFKLWAATPADFILRDVGICLIPFELIINVTSLSVSDDTRLTWIGTSPYLPTSSVFDEFFDYINWDCFNGDEWGFNRNSSGARGMKLYNNNSGIVGIFSSASKQYAIPAFTQGFNLIAASD